jgi:lipoate---protein ligase
VLGSAQRLEAPGAAVRRSTGGGAVSCDDHYLMLDVVLPRGHALVIDDVGQSYRWLADALQTALAARGAALRAVTPREAATRSPAERAAARLACFAGTGSYELLTSDGRKLVGLAQRRRGGAALLQAAAYIDAPRIDVAARLGLARDEEARLRERLAQIATLAEVAPGFADAPDVAIP